MRTNLSYETQGLQAPQRRFTVAEANAALVYVRPIVADITMTYAALMQQRNERDEIMQINPRDPRIESMRESIEQAVVRLNALYDELALVGCELKDWATGLVDFPAEYEGRPIWLCWKLGEDAVGHWHEINVGLAGRRPIDDQQSTA